MSIEVNLQDDIYYSDEYISLYLKENEELFTFEYKEGNNIFFNKTIKRAIKQIGNIKIDDGYFDLESAYGYGGYYTNSSDKSFLNRALKEYQDRCIKENIIAEFIRFHPFNSFPIKNSEYLDMNIYDRDVVFVDLTLSKEERWKNYSSKTRNILRKCEKELEFVENNDLDKFIELYYKTMNKNSADKFYYFEKDYFIKLLQNDKIKLYSVKKNSEIISSAFFMFSGDFGHYHLSANNYEMRKYNANYFILDRVFDIAKQQNRRYFILGGGTTGDKDDTLLKFKQKFSKNSKPFYISGKIFNSEIYNKYIELWQQQTKESVKYFLKYRLGIK